MSFGTKSDGDDAGADWANLIEGVLGGGTPAQGPSFVVFKDGSTYKARNGEDGTIDYSGTNFSTVVQDALNSNARVQVYLRSSLADSYDLGSTGITVPVRTSLIGVGGGLGTEVGWVTIDYEGTGVGITVEKDAHLEGIHIRKTGGTPTYLISIIEQSRVTLKNVSTYSADGTTYGLGVRACSVSNFFDLRLTNYGGLHITDYGTAHSNGNLFYGCKFVDCQAWGTRILDTGGTGNTFVGAQFEGNGGWGYEDNGLNNMLINPYFENNNHLNLSAGHCFLKGDNATILGGTWAAIENSGRWLSLEDTDGTTVIGGYAADPSYTITVDGASTTNTVLINCPLALNYSAGEIPRVVVSDVKTFTNDDLTPSVFGSDIWKTATGHGVAKDITMFDNGYVGQVLTIISSNPANATTVKDGGNLLINGDWTDGAEKTLKLVFDGTNWYEIARR